MEEKARHLLLQAAKPTDEKIIRLKGRVAQLRATYYDVKENWIKQGCDPSPGQSTLKELEKQLFELNKLSRGQSFRTN